MEALLEVAKPPAHTIAILSSEALHLSLSLELPKERLTGSINLMKIRISGTNECTEDSLGNRSTIR